MHVADTVGTLEVLHGFPDLHAVLSERGGDLVVSGHAVCTWFGSV
jgi:hypothetical protein